MKNGVCRFWGVLSHIVEEEFGLFLGIDGNASYLCNRIKKQASFKIVFFHIELLVLDHEDAMVPGTCASFLLGVFYCRMS